MEILKPIVTRRSIRKYKTDPVNEEHVMSLLESARIAPSGSNRQPWQFIVVRSDDLKRQIAEASHNQTWMLNAPVFIVCVADPVPRLKGAPSFDIDDNSPEPVVKKIIRDTAIAVENLVLQAESLGLATCWVAWFSQEAIRPILKVPADKYVLAIIPVGFANEEPAARPRKPLHEMMHYDTWGHMRPE
jgi:nitroreductase